MKLTKEQSDIINSTGNIKINAVAGSGTLSIDYELTTTYCEGINVRDLSKHFGRTKGAIRSRIKKLELVELYD